jgi:hypothetical protein
MCLETMKKTKAFAIRPAPPTRKTNLPTLQRLYKTPYRVSIRSLRAFILNCLSHLLYRHVTRLHQPYPAPILWLKLKVSSRWKRCKRRHHHNLEIHFAGLEVGIRWDVRDSRQREETTSRDHRPLHSIRDKLVFRRSHRGTSYWRSSRNCQRECQGNDHLSQALQCRHRW